MSDSPKYSRYRLQQQQEQRLREERRRRAKQEAARRKAEAERRRRERLSQARNSAQQEIKSVRRQLEALGSGGAAKFVQPEQSERLRERLNGLEQDAKKASSEKQVRRLRKELGKIESEIRRISAEAEAQLLSENLAEEEAALEGLRRECAAVNQEHAVKFDAAGDQEVRSLLDRADGLLKKKALEDARNEIGRCRTRLQQHQQDVAERLAQWTDERDRTAEAISEAGDRLAGLRADDVTMRWRGDRVNSLDQAFSQAEELLASEQFAEARNAAAALMEQADEVVAQAQAQQLDEDRRQYVVSGIVQAMQDHGLVVQAGYPALEHPNDLSSAAIIEAERLGGGAIVVSVPQDKDEEIMYDVDNFEMNSEVASDGQVVRTCDEAEKQIERVHAVLDEAFGIEMDELMWDGKPSVRIDKAADVLPNRQDTHRHQGG